MDPSLCVLGMIAGVSAQVKLGNFHGATTEFIQVLEKLSEGAVPSTEKLYTALDDAAIDNKDKLQAFSDYHEELCDVNNNLDSFYRKLYALAKTAMLPQVLLCTFKR